MWLLLSPLTLLLFGLLLLAIALLRRGRGLAVFAGLLAVLAVALMTPVGANSLVRLVESRVAAGGPACAAPEALVLLSGGLHEPPEHVADFDALTPESLRRAFGLLREPLPERMPLVVAGGGPYPVKEAEVLGELLVLLGANPRALLLEVQSLDTWQNAAEVRDILPPQVRHIVLASSALHLPRAGLVFRRAGFEVCMRPLLSHYVDARGFGAWWPQASGLRKSERALHELVGELWYRLRIGWDRGFGE